MISIKIDMKYTFLLFLVFIFSQCNSKNGNTNGSDMKDNIGKIRATLSDSIFETMPMNSTLTIYNFTNDTVKTGTDYSIECHSQNGWELFPFREGIGFDLVEISILPKQRYVMTLFFYPDIHNYSSGKYRIVKYYSIHKDRYTSYFEFDLK